MNYIVRYLMSCHQADHPILKIYNFYKLLQKAPGKNLKDEKQLILSI
jgi:hypothetical protein